MVCANCTAALLEDANFCLQCGKHTGRVAAVQPAGVWETCELGVDLVGLTIFLVPEYKLIITTSTAAGRTVVTDGPLFTITKWDKPDDERVGRPGSSGRKALDKQIALLLAAGWQLRERGATWYSFRFERRTESNQSASHSTQKR